MSTPASSAAKQANDALQRDGLESASFDHHGGWTDGDPDGCGPGAGDVIAGESAEVNVHATQTAPAASDPRGGGVPW